jgi:hypothetical protein
METTMRPMSTSQVLDKTFSMYRHGFLLFVGIAMLPQVCLLFGRMGLLLIGLGPSTNPSVRPTEAIAAAAASLMGAMLVLILAFVSYAVASAASVYAVSCTHLGYTITIKEAYRQIKPYILNTMGVVLLLGVGTFVIIAVLALVLVLVGVGFGIAGQGLMGSVVGIIVFMVGGLGLIVAALYASARVALSIPACVLERLGPVDAIRRSLTLTQGSALRLVLVIFLTAAVYYGLAMVLSIPYVIGLMRVFSSKNFAALTPYIMWQYIADFLASSLASPLAGIAMTLIYYDERVRKEAFDLQWMMVLLGQQSPQAVQSQTELYSQSYPQAAQPQPKTELYPQSPQEPLPAEGPPPNPPVTG